MRRTVEITDEYIEADGRRVHLDKPVTVARELAPLLDGDALARKPHLSGAVRDRMRHEEPTKLEVEVVWVENLPFTIDLHWAENREHERSAWFPFDAVSQEA